MIEEILFFIIVVVGLIIAGWIVIPFLWLIVHNVKK